MARRVVAELHVLTAESGQNLHLFLRTPRGSAVQIGALMNTLSARLYEWDNTQSPPRYVPTITSTPGLGSGPITGVHVE